MPRRSLIEYLDDFRRYGSEIAIVDRRGYRVIRTSYRRIAETASQFARELEACGIARGDRVVIWGENSAEWIVAFWGCLARGAVAVPMDAIASPEFARRVATDTAAKLLVATREKAQAFAGSARTVPEIAAVDVIAPVEVIAFDTLFEGVSRHDSSPFGASLDRTDTAEILFTSGTTADPKGVVITHGNVLANLEPLEAAIGEYRGYERLVHPLRFLNLVPLSHVFGQMMGIFVPPLLAGTVVLGGSLNPNEVIRAIRRERVSVLVAVPRMIESLRDKLERDVEGDGTLAGFRAEFEAAAKEKFYRRWWRFRRIHGRFGWKFWAIISGGATLDAELENFWTRLGFAVIQGYGLTETTSLVTLNHPFRSRGGSVGRALEGREIKLSPTGEILVRGESISSSYWQRGELRAVSQEEGWFATGDLGELDENGNLYFKGRKKNVIVTPEGMNIYPADLEAALRREPEVRDAVVVSLAGEGREEPCAVVLLRPEGNAAHDAEASAAAAVERANRSLAEYQRMRRWLVWPGEDFPRTSTGKPRVGEIRERAEAALGGSPSRATQSPIAAENTLAGLIGRITGRGPQAIVSEARLESDLNLTSIERVELLGAIEDRYQVELNETSFTAAATVGEIEKMLHESRPQRSAFRFPQWASRAPVAWLRTAVYYLLTWPATVLLACPRVRGRENLRDVRGPVLVICNHVTPIDIGWVLKALPLRFRHHLATAMAGERLMAMRHPPSDAGWLRRLFDPLGYFLVVALFHVFPLPKLSGFRESFEFAGELIERGESVLVFPEGELTKDGKIAPFRAGIGVLAAKLGVPIVPVRIDGLFEIRQAGKRIVRPFRVKVAIGSPIRFATGTAPESITRELQERVEALGDRG